MNLLMILLIVVALMNMVNAGCFAKHGGGSCGSGYLTGHVYSWGRTCCRY